jgi:glutathione-regulated potassium-efflux system protein KefB
MGFLQQALIFLAATVVAVPLSKRLGLGSVLGYLAAGAVIGPWGVKLISEVESVLHFAEFGVVLFLFLVGLELQPSRLWELRRSVFGVGGAQVGVTTVVLGAIGLLLGLPLPAAFVAGFGLSLSSTAFALQLLAEKNELTTPYGRASFGILLFQDLAVIPLLAALPFLGEGVAQSSGPMWLSAVKVVGVLAGVVLFGRFVMKPLFRLVASSHSQEVFTATALLIVAGTALLVSAVGLSMGLGAFLAGVMLADSDYRHELEADIEPFKGLLLGLFFIAVGMSVHLGLLLERPVVVVALVLGLTAVKALLLFGLGKLSLKDTEASASLGVALSQGGEFAFVLYGMAVGFKIVDQGTADLLILSVGLSMAVTPLLYAGYTKLLRARLKPRIEREFDVAPDEATPVIVAGFGRVGQVVGRVLRAKRITFTAMDSNPEHIDFIKKFGAKVFYGDASRLDLLRAAKADKAKVFVLAIDDIEASIRTAQAVQQHFPNLTIFARARNRQHAYRLLDLGIKHVMRETFSSSLEMTGDILQELGMTYSEARTAMDRFREHDEQLLMQNYKFANDQAKLQELAKHARAELERIFNEDAQEQRKSA